MLLQHMFLTAPRHEILAFEGRQVPYTSKLFYDLCTYRDQTSHKIGLVAKKLTTQLGFALLVVASLVEAAVRLPIAFLACFFSSTPGDWFAGLEMAAMTTAYATAVTVSNCFVDRVIPLTVDLECRLTYFSQNALLFKACEVGEYSAAKRLVQEDGADPHWIRPEGEVSTSLVPHLVGDEDMQELFPLNPYEKGFLELKRLGHWLGLDGRVEHEGRVIQLEGAQGHWFFSSLAESFQRFRTWKGFDGLSLSPEKADLMQEALIKAYATQDYETIAQRVQSGTLTFVGTGWKDHAICVAFFGDYMAIGNTGSKKPPTLQVFRVDSNHVTAEVIEEMLKHQFWPQEVGADYFYHFLPKKLSMSGKIEQDAICKNFAKIAPKVQKVGNCALASKKAALRFAWAMLMDSSPSLEKIEKARRESKVYTNLTAAHYLDETDPYVQYPRLQNFADRAYRKGEKKIRRVRTLCLELRHFPGLLHSFLT